MAWPEKIEADLTWIDDRFERGVRVSIGADGRIAAVERTTVPSRERAAPAGDVDQKRDRQPARRLEARPHSRRLRGAALLPGFVNAHSHAFQRGLRGRGESFPQGAGDFFTWRDAMYGLVERLTPERAYELSRDAFEEMLDGGTTAVGEFHYVRHVDPSNDAGRFVLDEAVIHAAIDAGIRVVLLHTAYETGTIGKPLQGGQTRFETRGVDDYWRAHDRLGACLSGRDDASLGVVAHSVRAVPIANARALRRGARERGQVFHMHVEEVVREVDECVAAHGRRPMRLVVDELEPDATFTAVHCTHTAAEDMERFARAGANVCLCPNTEGNLGDGIADVPLMRRAGASMAIGTDLNSRLCPFEDLRWLEYVQRVARRQRGVVVDAHGDSGPALLEIGTVNGARSLALDAGEIRAGAWADFCVVDIEHPSLADVAGDVPPNAASHGAGAAERSAGDGREAIAASAAGAASTASAALAAAIVFGAGVEAVAGTCVGGRWRPRRGARSALLPGGAARSS